MASKTVVWTFMRRSARKAQLPGRSESVLTIVRCSMAEFSRSSLEVVVMPDRKLSSAFVFSQAICVATRTLVDIITRMSTKGSE